MLLYNSDKKLFLGERNKHPGVWQFPQGGEEKGLSPEENVIKELHEETGADKKLFLITKKLSSKYEYDFLETPDYAKGIWRGQSQTFWMVQFIGNDTDFDLNRFEPEFMNFRWCDVEEVKQLAEPRRLKSYIKPLNEFILEVLKAGSIK